MFVSHPLDLAHNFFHFTTRPLNGSAAVALHLPTLHVAIHLVVPPLLLLGVVAQLADVMLDFCFIDQLQPTRLAHSVFFIALLAEVAPAPVTTTPTSLFEITHGQFVGGQLRSSGRDGQGEGVEHYIMNQQHQQLNIVKRRANFKAQIPLGTIKTFCFFNPGKEKNDNGNVKDS